MKRSFQTMLMFASIVFINCIHTAADSKKTIFIENIKYSFPITCDDATTIQQIKYKIQDAEGIPVDQQKLLKAELVRFGWIIPEKTSIELEDDKTCAYYDIQDQARLKLWLRQRRVQNNRVNDEKMYANGDDDRKRSVSE